MLKANKKILATFETLWVDFSDSGMPLIINLLYVNEPRQRKLMFTSDYYVTAIQLQTLLNCCTNEVSIMYFNTIKTAISIQMAPTIKIRKKLQFFFPCSYLHARFIWRQCVSIVLSARHFIGNKICRSVTLRATIQSDSFDSVKVLRLRLPLIAHIAQNMTSF